MLRYNVLCQCMCFSIKLLPSTNVDELFGLQSEMTSHVTLLHFEMWSTWNLCALHAITHGQPMYWEHWQSNYLRGVIHCQHSSAVNGCMPPIMCTQHTNAVISYKLGHHYLTLDCCYSVIKSRHALQLEICEMLYYGKTNISLTVVWWSPISETQQPVWMSLLRQFHKTVTTECHKHGPACLWSTENHSQFAHIFAVHDGGVSRRNDV